jgi:hypothetical protein
MMPLTIVYCTVSEERLITAATWISIIENYSAESDNNSPILLNFTGYVFVQNPLRIMPRRSSITSRCPNPELNSHACPKIDRGRLGDNHKIGLSIELEGVIGR